MPENDTLEYRVKLLEEDSKRNQTAHREFYSKFEGMKTENAVMASDLSSIKTLCAEIKSDVRALSDKPAKRWDGMVGALIGAIAAIAAKFMFTGGF